MARGCVPSSWSKIICTYPFPTIHISLLFCIYYFLDQNKTIKTAVSRAVWLPTNRKLLDPDPEKRMELSELPKYLEDKWIR
jgi:hypothetical protein